MIVDDVRNHTDNYQMNRSRRTEIAMEENTEKMSISDKEKRTGSKRTVARSASECVNEEAFTTDTTTTSHTGVVLRVQSVEQCAQHQVRWPDCKRKNNHIIRILISYRYSD